eukprot:TRINITY_DN5289_c0_g1_i2.p1 TRINITY_DN5289_c0_g1~~TRINITY_DN5289_c0_g1_i2.p1  ORF type:complete len:539 (+),score=110.72 TRINITY_DN5289_c0_g1_i2:85-1617(+)
MKASHQDGHLMPVTLTVTEAKEGGISVFKGQLNPITESVEAFATVDPNGIIISVNDHFWLLFGYAKDELVGENLRKILPQTPLNKLYLKRQAKLSDFSQKGTVIARAQHKDGSFFYAYLQLSAATEGKKNIFGAKITRVLPSQTKHSAYSSTESEEDISENEAKKHIGNYVVTRALSKGLFGKVYLAKHILTGEKVVLKKIKMKKVNVKKFKEMDVMKYLRHPGIVRLLEVIKGEKEFTIAIQYIGGGELFDYIAKRGKIDEDDARRFWRRIIGGVEYMHSKGISHRDLKLENIMLDENGEAVVIDMGLSNFIKPGRLLKTFCGSTAYAAPEMFIGRAYEGPEVDVWSLGVTLYCMVLGYLPFEDPQHVVDVDPVPIGDEEGVSDDLKDLLSRIFVDNVKKKRITMAEIRAHPWTTKGYNEKCMPEFGGHVEEKLHKNPDLMKKMIAFGFPEEQILDSVKKEEFNPITSALFLLSLKRNRKQKRKRSAAEKKNSSAKKKSSKKKKAKKSV